ncbi:hypothetical protein VTK26DRAFT_5990 [Humicola hyalothermophila]
MSAPDDRYFVYENRLASFQVPHPIPKGADSESRASKTLQWPHKALSPVALAKAGFFYEPYPRSPDNVVCFLCEKSLDGWGEGDDPVEEHLKHSPTCGWAIMAAIEAGFGNYGKVHPLDPAMIEARKATFAGRWPLESKRGVKCKTKKLVEAGWKYTPFTDVDDMVTCAYCHLELEGWEPGDDPYDEHYRRMPNCPFFVLISQYPAPKKGRAKAVRTSKASRLSVQSVATVATAVSDIASAADITADHDASVMTTASTMTQGAKKASKGRKATTGRGRKTKAKKDEAIEILEDEPQVPVSPARGRKRPSDATEDPVLPAQPAPKKRATRVRGSNGTEAASAAIQPPDVEMVDSIPTKKPAAKRKTRASTTKRTRKVSQSSVTSQASTASLRANLPGDDELDRQLEEDLERYRSDVEDPEPAVERAAAPRGRPKKAATARKTSTKRDKIESESYAMFDQTPIVADENEIEAELKATQADRERKHPGEPDTLVVPKKGRKAGTRKASRQAKKAKEPAPDQRRDEADDMALVPKPAQELLSAGAEQAQQEGEPEPEAEPGLDDPDISTGTVITKTASRPSTGKRGRGRPSKKSTSSEAAAKEPAQRRSSARLSKLQAQVDQAEPSAEAPHQSVPELKSTPSKISRRLVPPTSHSPAPAPIQEPLPVAETPTKGEKSLPPLSSSPNRLPHPPTTPRSAVTPSRLANQAVLSPSQSPQSSDAENRPPSSRQQHHHPSHQAAPSSNSMLSKRVALPPTAASFAASASASAATPLRNSSPSKRNVVAGLQSTVPWHAADVDALFLMSSSPAKSITRHRHHHHGGDGDYYSDGIFDDNADEEAKENGGAGALVLAKMLSLRRGDGELSEAEKQMTVEEWIYYNAELAEQKLKSQCEAMVSAFEREGSRAMRVLEGLVVD